MTNCTGRTFEIYQIVNFTDSMSENVRDHPLPPLPPRHFIFIAQIQFPYEWPSNTSSLTPVQAEL